MTPKVRFITETENKSVPILIPKMEIDGDGDCMLTVRDDEGATWSVAYIEASTGKLVLEGGLPDDSGLSVTPNGTIRTRKL